MPPKETLQRAIERLGSRSPHLTLAEHCKLASLRMNLRIIERLQGGRAGADLANGRAGQATRRDEGDDTTHR